MIAALLAGLASAAVLALFAFTFVDGLWRPDAFDYAQIARELAQGRGFGSRHAIYALHLDFLKEHGLLDVTWPNLHRFPLPSLGMALGFLAFGVGEAVVVGHGIVFHAATAALVFRWADQALGRAPALACLALLTVNGTLVEIACSGLAEPPVLFFFTAALYGVWRGGGAGRAACVGACLGLAGLARTNALFAAPLFAVALALAPGGDGPRARRALPALVAFALGIVLVSLPWWLRNQGVAGSPFFSLHGYFLLPSGTGGAGEMWYLAGAWGRQATPPAAFVAGHAGAVLAKAAGNLARLLAELPALAGMLGLVPLALLPAFLRSEAGLRPVAWLVSASFVWNALLVSFTDFFLLKYHLHFVPALVLLAVAGLWQLTARLEGPRFAVAARVLVVLAMTDLTGFALAGGRIEARIAHYDRGHWDVIRQRTSPDAVVVSDQSHAVAWETGRRSVRLHYDRTPSGDLVLGVLSLEDYLPVDAVYLSRQFLRDPGKLEVLSRTLVLVPGFRRAFPHLHQFEGGGLLFRRPGAATPRSPARAGAAAYPGRPPAPAPR
ncbi:MAG: ArnT family glycosyltransferase [Myxococcota bacterium]